MTLPCGRTIHGIRCWRAHKSRKAFGTGEKQASELGDSFGDLTSEGTRIHCSQYIQRSRSFDRIFLHEGSETFPAQAGDSPMTRPAVVFDLHLTQP
jgi:hypothetical protein